MKSVPRHWATGAVLNEAQMESVITLEGHAARIRFKVMWSGEKEHDKHHQEVPAVFVQPAYDQLVYCAEDQKEWKDGRLTTRTPGFPNEYFRVSEPWFAWVNKEGQGLGMWFPHADEVTCYRFRGGGRSGCSYAAPLQTFALKPGLVHEHEVAISTGTVEEMRKTFRKLSESGTAAGQ